MKDIGVLNLKRILIAKLLKKPGLFRKNLFSLPLPFDMISKYAQK